MKFDLPQDPTLAVRVIEAETAQADKRVGRGAMGWLLGTASEKPGNIAGFSIVVACVMIVVVAYIPGSSDFPKREIITLFGSVVPAALGYVFGRAAGKSD